MTAAGARRVHLYAGTLFWLVVLPRLARWVVDVWVAVLSMGICGGALYGASASAQLAAAMDGLGIERAHVVGHSMGGMIACSLAADHPDRVDRLALLCTGAALPPASAWTARAATVRAGGSATVAKAVVERWFTAEFLAAHPDVRATHEAMVAATPAEGYAGDSGARPSCVSQVCTSK